MPVKKGMKITQAQADAALEHDLNEVADALDRLVKVPLRSRPAQRGALVSFIFNIGEGALPQIRRSCTSSMLGDYDAVPAELARLNQSDGKVMQGLAQSPGRRGGPVGEGLFRGLEHDPGGARNPDPGSCEAGDHNGRWRPSERCGRRSRPVAARCRSRSVSAS